MSIVQRYELNDFEDIINCGFKCLLTPEAISIISKLAEEVGAPTYVKTPVFEKRDVKHRRHGSQSSVDSEWECVRDFKTTEITKKEGIGKTIDDIRGILNKMSNDNYDMRKKDLFELIDEVMESNGSDDNVGKIGKTLFDMASSNKFYSELYANLYKELMEKYDVFNNVFKTNFEQFMTLFDTIEYVNPAEDYDAFCNINKINEERKSLSMFFVNLMKQDIISHFDMIVIIEKLQCLIFKYMNEENAINKVEEVTENLFIIISNIKTELKDNVTWVNIFNKINQVSEYNSKKFPSLSNKVIFKHMDLIELLE